LLKIIYYVHGTTNDNINKLCSGWKDVALIDRGIEEASSLSKKTPYQFDVLFSSDLTRAVTSAQLSWPNINLIKDKRLRECNYGDYDGLSKELVKYEEHIDNPFPNGESLKDVETRIRDFLCFLLDNYNNKTVGIVAHRAPQLALDVIIKKQSWEEAIKNDWRKIGDWQPGWVYEIGDNDYAEKIKQRRSN
jgi:broad specificity phosphatase PhoE